MKSSRFVGPFKNSIIFSDFYQTDILLHYNKFPKKDWAIEEFNERIVKLAAQKLFKKKAEFGAITLLKTNNNEINEVEQEEKEIEKYFHGWYN